MRIWLKPLGSRPCATCQSWSRVLLVNKPLPEGGGGDKERGELHWLYWSGAGGDCGRQVGGGGHHNHPLAQRQRLRMQGEGGGVFCCVCVCVVVVVVVVVVVSGGGAIIPSSVPPASRGHACCW